jgi:hypothetical protein
MTAKKSIVITKNNLKKFLKNVLTFTTNYDTIMTVKVRTFTKPAICLKMQIDFC